MPEEINYVGDEAIIQYDTNIKSWFKEKIDTMPMMDLVYDEENRILEFIEKA